MTGWEIPLGVGLGAFLVTALFRGAANAYEEARRLRRRRKP